MYNLNVIMLTENFEKPHLKYHSIVVKILQFHQSDLHPIFFKIVSKKKFI